MPGVAVVGRDDVRRRAERPAACASTAAMPEANRTASAALQPAEGVLVARPRRVRLAPVARTAGRRIAGQVVGRGEDGPGRNGVPCSGAGSPAWTTRVASFTRSTARRTESPSACARRRRTAWSPTARSGTARWSRPRAAPTPGPRRRPGGPARSPCRAVVADLDLDARGHVREGYAPRCPARSPTAPPRAGRRPLAPARARRPRRSSRSGTAALRARGRPHDHGGGRARPVQRGGRHRTSYRTRRSGGGWPQTFADAADGLDRLAELRDDGGPLDLDRVVAVGFSAGAPLARGRPRAATPPSGRSPRSTRRLSDLDAAARSNNESAGARRGRSATRDEAPEPYEPPAAVARLPLGDRPSCTCTGTSRSAPVASSEDVGEARGSRRRRGAGSSDRRR